MFGRTLAAALAAAVIAAAFVLPAAAREVERSFMACKRIEDLMKVTQFKDNYDALIAYIVKYVSDGKCVLLNKGDDVEVVDTMPTISMVIIDFGAQRLYTSNLVFEKQDD
jgi:hypothetical protein